MGKVETLVEIGVGKDSCNHDQGWNQKKGEIVIDQDQSQCLDLVQVSTNGDRIRCCRCREYDHFARECPNSITDKDSDNNDFDLAALQMLMRDNSTSSDTCSNGLFKHVKGKNGTNSFLPLHSKKGQTVTYIKDIMQYV